jgi:DNA polymerase-3 subunit alpha
LKVLGPVVTSKSIGKSYLQIKDLFVLAKKYGFKCIVLSESHPKSWLSFIYLCQKNKIKPIILYEADKRKFMLKNNEDLRQAIMHYNKLIDNLNLKEVDLSLPYVRYPIDGLKKIFKDSESWCVKDALNYQKDLASISYEDTFYNLKEYTFKEYKVRGKSIVDYLKDLKMTDIEKKRLSYELNTVKKLAVENYILTVKEIVDAAAKKDIFIGPGRGSAVGSFLVYKLGITKVNPLKYGLLFERFLNEYRHELPDIDIDVDADRRNELIKTLQENMGFYKVAQIRTYSTMKIKSALKKSEELLGYTTDLQLLPPIRSRENLKNLSNFSNKEKIFYILAYYLEGIETAESTHAAGLVISANDLRTFAPLEEKNIPIIEWEMSDLKIVGVEKFDILSLDTLSFLKKLEVKEEYEKLEDASNYKYLSMGLTKGIFQLDSRLGKRLSKKIKPKNFEELVLLLAINRPGPLESGMIDQYLENSAPGYLKNIFPETKGVLVYQEQIMKLSQILGEFSPEESDLLRKAMSKKEKDKIIMFKEKFISNTAKKIGNSQANLLFSQLENFSQYAFNKSHAVAYAHISYWLMDKKFKNPSHFFLELIKLKGLDIDIINEAKILGVDVNSPDIRFPHGKFDKAQIILPLYSVKGIGKNIADMFVNCKFQNVEDFFDFSISKNLNRNIIELLIKCGSLDHLNDNRKKLLKNSTELLRGRSKELQEIGRVLFGDKKREDLNNNIFTELEDYARYDIETIGFPITLINQKGLSDTLIKKYLNDEKVVFDGYVYREFLIDNSGIMYTKIYNKNLKRLKKII